MGCLCFRSSNRWHRFSNPRSAFPTDRRAIPDHDRWWNESGWSPDGKQLFYNTVAGPDQTTAPGKPVAVDIRTQPGFTFGKPTPISVAGAILGGTGTNYDITPDGKQFVVVQSAPNTTADQARRSAQINIVLNWFEELKQRVPVK